MKTYLFTDRESGTDYMYADAESEMQACCKILQYLCKENILSVSYIMDQLGIEMIDIDKIPRI